MESKPIAPEVVEAVAKAIYDRYTGRKISWEDTDPFIRASYRIDARAAIAEYLKQTGAGK